MSWMLTVLKRYRIKCKVLIENILEASLIVKGLSLFTSKSLILNPYFNIILKTLKKSPFLFVFHNFFTRNMV